MIQNSSWADGKSLFFFEIILAPIRDKFFWEFPGLGLDICWAYIQIWEMMVAFFIF